MSVTREKLGSSIQIKFSILAWNLNELSHITFFLPPPNKKNKTQLKGLWQRLNRSDIPHIIMHLYFRSIRCMEITYSITGESCVSLTHFCPWKNLAVATKWSGRLHAYVQHISSEFLQLPFFFFKLLFLTLPSNSWQILKISRLTFF